MKQRSLNSFQIRHPESCLSSSNQCSTYCIFKYFVHSVVCKDARLIVTNAEFFSHCSRFVRHHQITFLRRSKAKGKRGFSEHLNISIRILLKHLTNLLRSPKYDKYVSSLYMYLKSFLQPTKITGTSGQNFRISGYHIARQFRNDTGLAIEKHSSTTSERP